MALGENPFNPALAGSQQAAAALMTAQSQFPYSNFYNNGLQALQQAASQSQSLSEHNAPPPTITELNDHLMNNSNDHRRPAKRRRSGDSPSPVPKEEPTNTT